MPHSIVPSRHPMCHRLRIGLSVRPSARFWKVRLVEPETAHERFAPTTEAVPELCGPLCDQTALGGADRLAAPRSRRAIGRCAPSIALYGVGAWPALVAGYTESGPPLPSMRVPWRTAPLRRGLAAATSAPGPGSNPATSAPGPGSAVPLAPARERLRSGVAGPLAGSDPRAIDRLTSACVMDDIERHHRFAQRTNKSRPVDRGRHGGATVRLGCSCSTGRAEMALPVGQLRW